MNVILTLSQFATQAFFSALWQGAILVLAVTLSLHLIRLTPVVRFAIWSAAFLSAAAIPLVHLSTPPAAMAPTPTLHISVGWAFAIAAAWTTLSSIRLTRLTLNALSLHRIWNNASPVCASTDIRTILNATPRHPELCLSKDADSPSVIGFFAPRILIPDSLYPTLTQPELRQIILHECEHLRRGDDWINLLQKFALALFPLNPALWVADRRLGFERELACDAAVVTASSTPLAYASALTRLAERCVLRRSLTLALSIWGRQSELARRVYTLLRPAAAISPLRTRASLAVLLAALATGTFELAHAPHLVSFTEVAAEASTIALPRPLPVVYDEPSRAESKFRHRKSASHRLTQLKATAQPRIILTGATITKATRRLVRPAYLLKTDFSPSYAAVPFADGWLIIQL